MAKRFRDTGCWDKEWFRKLGSFKRDVLAYLYDKCDNAGLWEVDLETLKYFTGQDVTLIELRHWFGDRIQYLEHECKIFLPGFIAFQYGELHPDSKPHQSVIKRLKEKDLFEGYSKGTHTLKDKDKDKDKDKGTGTVSSFDFESLYRDYPRKKGKTRGMAICRKSIKTQEDFDLLAKAIANYRSEIQREKTEPKFIKYFSSFMGAWRDYIPSPDSHTQTLSPLARLEAGRDGA